MLKIYNIHYIILQCYVMKSPQVNSRINFVFQRLNDLEKTSPSEWLEWNVPKI